MSSPAHPLHPRRSCLSRCSRQHRRDTRHSRLRGKVSRKQIRRPIPRKRPRHPRILVVKIPHRDAHTARHIHTRLHRRRIIRRLLRLRRTRRRHRNPHVQLRQRHLDPERRERLQVRDLRLVARRRVADEVALQSDAVDAHALRLQVAHQLLCRARLGPCVLDVIVVVVELGGGVGGRGRAEGDGDEGGPDGVEPDVGAVGAVVVERLVDDVPGVAAAFVVSDDVGDVVLERGDQGGVGPVARGEPGWVLVVPVEVVAARDHAVVERGVDDGVAFGVVEDVLFGFGGVPL